MLRRYAVLMGVLMLGLGACSEFAGVRTAAAGADTDDGKDIIPVIDPERDENGQLVKIEKTPEEWKDQLSPTEFYILREKGTERAFTGRYHDSKEDGVYVCAGCNLALYDSKAKFDSGTGWPSYSQAVVDDHVGEHEDRSFGMTRVEIVCARCDGHLGHVFPDGPKPTYMRHCVNGYSLRFIERETYEASQQTEAEAESSPETDQVEAAE